MEAEEFYEAHQIYRTIYYRLNSQQKFDELLPLLYLGALEMEKGSHVFIYIVVMQRQFSRVEELQIITFVFFVGGRVDIFIKQTMILFFS